MYVLAYEQNYLATLLVAKAQLEMTCTQFEDSLMRGPPNYIISANGDFNDLTYTPGRTHAEIAVPQSQENDESAKYTLFLATSPEGIIQVTDIVCDPASVCILGPDSDVCKHRSIIHKHCTWPSLGPGGVIGPTKSLCNMG